MGWGVRGVIQSVVQKINRLFFEKELFFLNLADFDRKLYKTEKFFSSIGEISVLELQGNKTFKNVALGHIQRVDSALAR